MCATSTAGFGRAELLLKQRLPVSTVRSKELTQNCFQQVVDETTIEAFLLE